MSANITILDAVKGYYLTTHKYMNNKKIEEKFLTYYSPEFQNMTLWNTVFHYEIDLQINLQNIKNIYDHYSSLNCEGYLFSYTNEFKDFSIFEGCFFYLDSKSKKIGNMDQEEFKIASTDDLDNFTKQIDMEFHIGEFCRQKLAKLLSDMSKGFYHQSYLGYYKGSICGTVSVIECEPDSLYIFNLGVLPEFQKLGLSKKILSLLTLEHPDKNMYVHTEFNNVLCNSVLPNLGFKFLGAHHLLDITKLYKHLKNKKRED